MPIFLYFFLAFCVLHFIVPPLICVFFLFLVLAALEEGVSTFSRILACTIERPQPPTWRKLCYQILETSRTDNATFLLFFLNFRVLHCSVPQLIWIFFLFSVPAIVEESVNKFTEFWPLQSDVPTHQFASSSVIKFLRFLILIVPLFLYFFQLFVS